MKAADVMTADVVSVGPETEISEIAQLLATNRISAVPVVDAGGKVLGMVSEGDLVCRAAGERCRSWWLSLLADRSAEFVRVHGTRARDVMTGDVISVGKDVTLSEIAHILESHSIKRVPVVEDGQLVGIVSRADVLRGLASLDAFGADRSKTSDNALRREILEIIRTDTSASVHAVSVIVVSGVAYLWGVADRQEDHEAIRVAAESVAGPDNVRDHMNTLQQVLEGV